MISKKGYIFWEVIFGIKELINNPLNFWRDLFGDGTKTVMPKAFSETRFKTIIEPHFEGHASLEPLDPVYRCPEWLLRYTPSWLMWLVKVEMWHYKNDIANPKIWVDAGGDIWKTSNDFDTDLGSVGPQVFVSDNEYPYPFCFHDDSYVHGGLQRLDKANGIWIFWAMTKDQCDCMLRDMVLASPGKGDQELDAKIIYFFVSKFGKGKWEKFRN